MKKIKILPEGLIDRIAAGEVIENPASVIKELLENSLDASSTSIEISVSVGGKEEILIVDNGEGIHKDEVEIAFMRHATSKIRGFDDLLRTFTMGFRGEALPSISSVSIMELSTCSRDENVGTKIRFEGGKQTHLGPAPPNPGCSISVRNLFYNVPARRKFLKSDTSERRKISEILRRYIIARNDVSFKVIYDGKVSGSYPAADDPRRRLADVWGNDIGSKLLEIKQEPVGPVTVRGFISPPDLTRGNRSEMFFFVNNRPVIEKAMFGAVAAAYEGSLPGGQFPYAAVFLDIDPGFVDINVHPAKIEVRFADSGFIFGTLKKAMKSTLRLPIGLSLGRPATGDNKASIPFEKARRDLFERIQHNHADTKIVASDDQAEKNETLSDELTTASADQVLQIYDTYIIARIREDIIILDQHTAHERILFEKNLAALNDKPSPSQKLLFESRVKLTPEEFAVVEELGDMLEKTGFELRQFGNNEVIISGVPQELGKTAPESALKEILSDFGEFKKSMGEIKSAVAASIACKAAVKAGHRLTEPQMKGLYSQLLRCKEPYRCPHGRPTIVTMSRNDLERIFQRI